MYMLLDVAESFFLRDAGIGHAIVALLEQLPLLLGRKVAVVRDSLVMVMSDKIHDVLFEVRSGAGDDLHFVLADHLGKRNTEFGGTHRSGKGDHHLAAGVEVCYVCFRSIDKCSGIEMTIVMDNKIFDG